MACILVLDPELKDRLSLMATLTRGGHRVLTARTGTEAFTLARADKPEIVLFELDLPDMNAGMIISQLRTQSTRTPLIVVSARSTEQDRVTALDLGADDYLTKPFGDEELLARIRVALRRRATEIPKPTGVIRVGDLILDLNRRLVFARGDEVHLTPTEYALFALLMQRRGMVVPYSDLLQEIRGPKSAPDRSYLRVYIVQLRRKLEVDPSHPMYLLTEPNAGYRLIDPQEA